MALSADQIAEVRVWIGAGAPPTDDDLAAIYDRLGSTAAVALEVLQGRYATAITGPAKWAVDGDFSIDNTEVIKALAKQIGDLKGLIPGSAPALTTASIIRCDPWR